ncbi:DUF1120 domain-containing protein [Pseudomonas trivialis]|uniref:Protein GltF n=1 Tax=Pseudomonas trivialis TaxID=200450 RepID=A0A0H5A8A7_9PSED|nr:DUF1120 domain-containing protein [Pseudomonas trivialis]AKS06223.1 hypothetical protein AA957_08920 [Pseudomonas trivialis]
MSKSLNTLFAALLLSSAGNVLAASSVDLTVKGLITPSACEPTLSNGGVVDIGKISAKDLNADQETHLPSQYLQLGVTCDAATLMALEATDNREGSNFADDMAHFGLGLTNDSEKLGGMELRIVDPIADGVSPWIIGLQNGSSTWIRSYYFARDNILSVANTGGAIPIPVQQFTSSLRINPIIAPTSGLTLNNEVAIDGSVTLTVIYL